MITSPSKAIKQKCFECSCKNKAEVRSCPVESCPLYPFRFGKNPYRKRKDMTDEQRVKAAERLKACREKKNK